MAHEGQQITNPRTGQRMTFIEMREDLLRIESVNPPTAEWEPEHVHPRQESGLMELISGSLVFEVEGEARRLGPGDTITVPPNTRHRFWNDGDTDAHSIQFFRPALDIASFFETFFELAHRGLLDEKGVPSSFQLAVTMGEFSDELRPTSPPWPVIRLLTLALGPIARARGYQGRLTA